MILVSFYSAEDDLSNDVKKKKARKVLKIRRSTLFGDTRYTLIHMINMCLDTSGFDFISKILIAQIS